MLQFPAWKVILVLVICAFGAAMAAPNLLSRSTADSLPDWLPHKQINLGLDLQGGSHLLMEVDVNSVIKDTMNSLVDDVRSDLRKAQIGYVGLGTNSQGNAVVFTLRDPSKADEARSLIRKNNSDLDIKEQAGQFTIALSEHALRDETRRTVDQSIEIISRRIDETGTREPTIQREGEDRILVQLPGVKDPERIKELLGKTAKLTLHLVDPTASLQDIRSGHASPGNMILPAADNERGGPPAYEIRKRVIVGGERLVDAQATFEQGRPVVSFRFDTAGGKRFGDATRDNVGKQLAIVLDGKVISAPVIREPILGGNGIISGNFTTEQAKDLALLLRAGALPAPLNILEERSVGPSLGEDSIRAGKIACFVGFLLVVGFMALVYGFFGLIADVALLLNLVLLLGSLSLLQATLTLPGIAGIVLTLGMAVDANVLIYERIREEVIAGRTVLSAVGTGFERAFATIMDSNLTTFIAGALLYIFGSGPVKGFAVTLTLGLITSMFTAVMVTRMMVVTWLRRTRPKALPV